MDLEQLSRRGCADHEASHAVVLWKGKYPEFTRGISIVPSGDSAGRTETSFDTEIDAAWLPCDSMERRVIVILAGRAAERKLFGANSGFNSTAVGDLKKARTYVAAMASDQKERRSAMRSLAAQSKRMVETHWPIIEAVAEALLVEEEMDRDRFMSADEALEYGLIDNVIRKKTDLEEEKSS